MVDKWGNYPKIDLHEVQDSLSLSPSLPLTGVLSKYSKFDDNCSI